MYGSDIEMIVVHNNDEFVSAVRGAKPKEIIFFIEGKQRCGMSCAALNLVEFWRNKNGR